MNKEEMIAVDTLVAIIACIFPIIVAIFIM